MRKILYWFCLSLIAGSVTAQINESVFQSAAAIDSSSVGELRFELDNVNFFKDDEFAGGFQKGYTLPGFWIQPKLVYFPLKNIKVELGAHLLHYWGAKKYPCYAYHDIAKWSGSQYHKGFHALPWFRAQVDFSRRFSLVLGDIYGVANHQLIEPLYNPEMNLMADPEAGVQLLYNSSRFFLDVWVNWQSFIFREDTHQEAFIIGLSSKINLNDPSAKVNVYLPVQLMAQHRGGEIDTIYTNSVQTLMNGALGLGAVWNTGHSLVNKVGIEADAAFSYQQAGHLWPFDTGWGTYLRMYADCRRLRVKAAYWQCKKFVSLTGSPFYNAISMQDEGTVFHSPKMVCAGLEYTYPFAKAFAVGADLDVYCHLKGDKSLATGELVPKSSATSFSAGVYLRINPSILIKNFQK